MPQYEVTLVQKRYFNLKIEADSPEQAEDKAYEEDFSDGDATGEDEEVEHVEEIV